SSSARAEDQRSQPPSAFYHHRTPMPSHATTDPGSATLWLEQPVCSRDRGPGAAEHAESEQATHIFPGSTSRAARDLSSRPLFLARRSLDVFCPDACERG